MPTPTALRVFAAAALTVGAAAACSPSEPTATTPGTTPSVFTGSPAPNAPETASTTTSAQPAGGQTVKADVKAPDGTTVATAEFDFTGTYGTLTVKTTRAGVLAPGFHGLHVHSVGKCEASSVAPTGGAPGDFNSAGGHYQRPGHTAHPASGDLTSLEVRGDGSATLVTTTDAFTADDLLAGAGTALIIHEKSDNFANIPPERYQQTNGGTPGPDETTMSTGDAGKRVACGVLTVG